MSYQKPILQALDMSIDVAACKPCRGGVFRAGFCLPYAQKSYFQVDSGGGFAVAAEVASTTSDPLVVDAQVVLP